MVRGSPPLALRLQRLLQLVSAQRAFAPHPCWLPAGWPRKQPSQPARLGLGSAEGWRSRRAPERSSGPAAAAGAPAAESESRCCQVRAGAAPQIPAGLFRPGRPARSADPADLAERSMTPQRVHPALQPGAARESADSRGGVGLESARRRLVRAAAGRQSAPAVADGFHLPCCAPPRRMCAQLQDNSATHCDKLFNRNRHKAPIRYRRLTGEPAWSAHLERGEAMKIVMPSPRTSTATGTSGLNWAV